MLGRRSSIVSPAKLSIDTASRHAGGSLHLAKATLVRDSAGWMGTDETGLTAAAFWMTGTRGDWGVDNVPPVFPRKKPVETE